VADVQRCAEKLEVSLTGAQAELMARSIERGDRMDGINQRMPDDSSVMTSCLAPRVPGGKPVLHKLKNAWHNDEAKAADVALEMPTIQKHNPGESISTATTRAIGDWDGSRAQVPHPEILRFKVPTGGCMRAVLASDGLWDLMTPDEASDKALCRARDAQACANQLRDLARDRSNQRFNALKDDITVLVVELQPQNGPVPLLRGVGGCCIVA